MELRPITDWLPLTMKEVEKRGWEEIDVVLISGDSYVDHPSFGTAVIGRIMEDEGFKVAIVAQPNWQDDLRDFKKFGRPKYFFGVTAGCMDSMVNHYTANRRLRSTDAYTAGGESGFRPDYATVTYSKILKELFPDVPVLIGGIEASLRRVTHYDYWSDTLKPSILEESGADMLVYGMGDQPLREMLQLLKKGVPFESLKTIKQTAFLMPKEEPLPKNKNWETVELSSHEICLEDKIKFAANFKVVEVESNKWQANRITQDIGDQRLVINPPYKTMEEGEIDQSFDLPYTRLPHPKYKKRGNVPAFEMIRFSVNTHRGCFGGCSFCTISAHQGKFIASRSKESIMKEVDQVASDENKMKGIDESICAKCSSPSCIHPVVCSNLDTDHSDMTALYREIDSHPKVKKAFVGSGIRYDLLVDDFNKTNKNGNHEEYIEQVVTRHVSGRLKVAPEHTSDATLKVMRKPSFKYFHKFKEKYDKIQEKHGLKQQLIPYFISSHPGCEEQDMANLSSETKDMGFQLEQVQDFTPTPMTVATVIYYTGVHPYTLKPVYTAKTRDQKQNQHRFFFWYKKENHQWIKNQLMKAQRPELIDILLGKNADKPNYKGRKKKPSASNNGKPMPKWLAERRKKDKK